ncbi:MAG: hypothetical protein WB988_02065, partial [Candidatus Nitrosopolaris sp.]
ETILDKRHGIKIAHNRIHKILKNYRLASNDTNKQRRRKWVKYRDIKKNGCYRSYPKFYCKRCKKNFNDKTDTIFHYSHTPLKKWLIVQYLFFVSWGIIRNGNIIRDCFILHMLQICYNCYGENR